jgi:hypothetical protein
VWCGVSGVFVGCFCGVPVFVVCGGSVCGGECVFVRVLVVCV